MREKSMPLHWNTQSNGQSYNESQQWPQREREDIHQSEHTGTIDIHLCSNIMLVSIRRINHVKGAIQPSAQMTTARMNINRFAMLAMMQFFSFSLRPLLYVIRCRSLQLTAYSNETAYFFHLFCLHLLPKFRFHIGLCTNTNEQINFNGILL